MPSRTQASNPGNAEVRAIRSANPIVNEFKRPKLPDFRRMTREEIRQFTDQFEDVFFAIPLDGQFCFGRVLRATIIGCYDLRAPTILSIDDIERAPILFRVSGAIATVLGGRRWKILGRKPLADEAAQPSKFYRERYLYGEIDIYCDGRYQPYDGEDLSRISRLTIVISEHVEERLHHHFAGTVYRRGSNGPFNPALGRPMREKYRALLSAGEKLPPDVAHFLTMTTETQLNAYGRDSAGKRREDASSN